MSGVIKSGVSLRVAAAQLFHMHNVPIS